MAPLHVLVVTLAASAIPAAREEADIGRRLYPAAGLTTPGADAELAHGPRGSVAPAARDEDVVKPRRIPAGLAVSGHDGVFIPAGLAVSGHGAEPAHGAQGSVAPAARDEDVVHDAELAHGPQGPRGSDVHAPRAPRAEHGPANANQLGASFAELCRAAVAIPRKYLRWGFTGGLVLMCLLILVLLWRICRRKEACVETDSEAENCVVPSVWSKTTWLDKAAASKVTPHEGAHVPVDLIEPKWTVEALTQLLASHDAPEWEDDALQNMVRELSQGKAQLCKSGNQLRRVIDMVIVLIVYEPEQLVLQILSQPAHRRAFTDLNERTVKARRIIWETLDEAVGRCLESSFGTMTAHFGRWEFMHDCETHEGYAHMPGVPCLIRKHIARCSVIASCPADLKALGLPDGRLELADYVYTWLDIKDTYNLRKYKNELIHSTRARVASSPYFTHDMVQKTAQKTTSLVNTNLTPFIPWFNSSVELVLNEHSFTFTSGDFGLKTMHDLVLAMQEGRLELGVRRDAKNLVGVVDVVSVLIRSRNDMSLARCGSPLRLPYVQKLPSETVPMAASRLTREKLGLSSDFCHQEEGLDTWEMSDSFFVEIGLPRGSARNVVLGRGYTTRWFLDVDVDEAKQAVGA